MDTPTRRAASSRRSVERLRATYTFTAALVRAGDRPVREHRARPALYTDEVGGRSAAFSGSALFAYKLNWQTVLFVGYGDDRELIEDIDASSRADRQFF